MANNAGNAVARQRAVFAVRLLRQGVNNVVRERLFAIAIELSLAHYSVTPVAGVIEEFPPLGIESLFRFKLRMKDWIASAQTHHRGSPFSVRRHVDRLSL